jgi:hypothetical protein
MFRYCRGIDRGDADLTASVYQPGALDRHGPYCGPAGAPFATQFIPKLERAQGLQHLLGNMLIELAGEAARVETYFVATYREKENVERVGWVAGRYLDRFERRDGTWLIAKRTVVHDWSARVPMALDPSYDAYPLSHSNLDDPLYQHETWSRAEADDEVSLASRTET